MDQQPATADFRSARARLRRAEQQRHEMAEMRKAERQASSFRVERSLTGSKLEFVASYTPPEDFEVIFGDWLHNTRSALDHLFFQLAVADTGQNPPSRPRARQFPITRTVEDFNRIRETDTFHGMHERTIDSVESMQPYHTKYGADGNVLVWLHDHARTDRHRKPWELGTIVRSFNVNFPNEVRPYIVGWDRLDPETTPAVIGQGDTLVLLTLRFTSTADARRLYGLNTVDVHNDLEVVDWYRAVHRDGISANIRNDSLETRMKFVEQYMGMVLDHFEKLLDQSTSP